MNATEVTHGNAQRKLLEPAASPLPFAVRARRSTPLLSTCLDLFRCKELVVSVEGTLSATEVQEEIRRKLDLNLGPDTTS
jgi:hypothetical protein